jgi:thymidylate kinase
MAVPGAPYLVEVTGVAGSGKSTLVRGLCDELPDTRRATFIETRDPRHLAALVGALPDMAPVLVGNLWRRPRMSWADVKLLAYVTRWDRVLRRTPAYRSGITTLDQGPLYALVRLRAQGRRIGHTAAFARWWERSLARWAPQLGAVVYLDADDAVLLGRINHRDQAHATKGEPEDDARAFLARYRSLFDETLARLERLDGPTVLRFDTGVMTSEEILERLRPVVAADGVWSDEVQGAAR